MIFADVIVDISVKSLDRPFQYIVPEEMMDEAVIGARVKIPFGQGNRTMRGYIIGLSGTPAYDVQRTKSILEIEKQGVVAESHLLSLAYWIKENYGSTMNEAIKAVLPVKQEIREKIQKQVFPVMPQEALEQKYAEYQKKHYRAKERAVKALLYEKDAREKGIDYSVLLHRYQLSSQVLLALEKEGILRIESNRFFRNPETKLRGHWKPVELNEEQRAAAERIRTEYRDGKRGVYLLHGVTGSGKTEVYMDVIEDIVAQGKQVIVLVPEIALTFQTLSRFFSRFGKRVSVMHSRLSQGERFDQFELAKRGETDIMIGPRSALFTPFPNLGLIVMDEEHEASYQSEMPPKYHAREVAVKRAQMTGASVILGSATPSMEAYYRAKKGEYTLLELKKRAGGAVLPKIWITDLREELEKKNYSIFGQKLAELIEDRLQKKEQCILFLNRRGYAGFVSCRKCGEPIQCPHCSVSMKAHMQGGKLDHLVCHYCGFEMPMPQRCPKCGSKYIGTFGIGTQKVEQMVRERFPKARVLRMDADTTTGKNSHETILQNFSEGRADILVGTQMIVKGHDFPNVTLVGILAADLSLNVEDFRAAERTYQLLAQAAGRAGRGQKMGDVVLQTYQPEHYSIQCAAKQDYGHFFEQELSVRQMLHYPPVSNILGVLVLSEKQEQAQQCAVALAECAKKYENIVVLGPAPAYVAKIKDIYRMMIYAKSPDFMALRQMKNELIDFLKGKEEFADCRIQFERN